MERQVEPGSDSVKLKGFPKVQHKRQTTFQSCFKVMLGAREIAQSLNSAYTCGIVTGKVEANYLACVNVCVPCTCLVHLELELKDGFEPLEWVLRTKPRLCKNSRCS